MGSNPAIHYDIWVLGSPKHGLWQKKDVLCLMKVVVIGFFDCLKNRLLQGMAWFEVLVLSN